MEEKHLRRIILRKGYDSQRRQVILEEGELVYTVDGNRIFVGDQQTLGGSSVTNKTIISNDGTNEIPQSLDLVYDTTTHQTSIIGADGFPIILDTTSDEIWEKLKFIDEILTKVEDECCNTACALITDDNVIVLTDYGDWFKLCEPKVTAVSWVIQPINITINEAQTATFTVSATSTETITYAWFRLDNSVINSSNTKSRILTISNAQLADNMLYYCVATTTSLVSITSNSATLQVNHVGVNTAPAIILHPLSQKITSGSSVTLSGDAIGTAPLTYQWRINGVDVAGATGKTYTIPNITTDIKNITFVVSNGVGSAVSNVANLTVGILFGKRHSISAGLSHTLALGTDGTLSAWGLNIGDGTTLKTSSPVKINLPLVESIACGNLYTIALGTDGGLSAWGQNIYSEIGDGTTTTRLSPVKINLPSVSNIACGWAHTFAVGIDGTLSAWGYNAKGQLGDGTTLKKSSPVKINIPPVAAIAGGFEHTLAVGTDGGLSAWGLNSNGQLGNNSTTDSLIPIKISLPPVAAIACGTSYTIALGTDGGLSAWGFNSRGQLGDGTKLQKKSPVKINIPPVAAIACGDSHTLAVGTDGGLSAWGYNSTGQLGNSSTTNSLVPIKISLPPVAAIRCGDSHTLAVGTDGGLSAWGYNGTGQLGDGSVVQKTSPTKINLPPVALP